jgi:hypothetical protein
LFILDPSGKIISIIEKNSIAESITENEKNRAIESEIELWKRHHDIKLSKKEVKQVYKFSKNKPFFNRILTDNTGNIYIMKFKIGWGKKGLNIDLFNKKGFYIYEIKINTSGIPLVIRQGSIYTSDRDLDTGSIRIRRYKINNWNALKTYDENYLKE